jgi:hypothetical protein
MIKNTIILVFIFPILIFYGCAGNPYARFYFDYTGGKNLTQMKNVIIPNTEPALYTGSNPEKDMERMLEDGYFLIGYSSFNAGNVNQKRAIYQAKKVHASTVLLYSRYTNTVSGNLPLTLPDNRTSTTYGSGNVYGSGNIYGSGGSAYYTGRGYYSGSSTTTTYGTKTMYLPYNVNRFDYMAVYFGKFKSFIFGVHVQDLSPEEKRENRSNKGVKIIAVVKGSPAYKNDFFKGDVITKINEVEVYDKKSFPQLAERFLGEKVKVEIIRDGELMTKEVKFNEKPNL